MADEVLDSIVESFRYPDQDTAWHGGCLALAEVARRGLLLPHRVPELAPLMATALQYDLRRGAHRWEPRLRVSQYCMPALSAATVHLRWLQHDKVVQKPMRSAIQD